MRKTPNPTIPATTRVISCMDDAARSLAAVSHVSRTRSSEEEGLMPATATRAQVRARVALAAAVAIVAVWIGAAFVPAILWAAVVGIAVEPLRLRLLRRWPGNDTLVATLITLTVILIVVVPLVIAVTRVIAEVETLPHGSTVPVRTACRSQHGLPISRWDQRSLPHGGRTTWRRLRVPLSRLVTLTWARSSSSRSLSGTTSSSAPWCSPSRFSCSSS